MLVFTRYVGQRFMITKGDTLITIQLLTVSAHKPMKLGFTSTKQIAISRVKHKLPPMD